jgi:hypothetical protein
MASERASTDVAALIGLELIRSEESTLEGAPPSIGETDYAPDPWRQEPLADLVQEVRQGWIERGLLDARADKANLAEILKIVGQRIGLRLTVVGVFFTSCLAAR